MDALFFFLAGQPVVALFLIIGLGLAVGNIKLFGFSLGSSAVLFVAMVFGHFGIHFPKEIEQLGVILFVYAVGLQVGPRFFHSIRLNGLFFLLIAFTSLLAAASGAWVISKIFHISPSLAVGVFAGALTSTPALASALDVLKDPSISVGYGIAYPFGVIGIVLFVQWVARLPKTRQELAEEQKGQKSAGSKVLVKQYIVTNPNCAGKPLVEIHFHGMTQANITRVMRDERIFMAHDDTELQLDDVVMAVGAQNELKKLEHLIGRETQVDMELTPDITSRDVYVSSPKIAGKTLGELEVKELFGVVLTRLWRDEIEFVPTGSTTLEFGDLIRVVGDKDDCDRFLKIVGQHERRIHETNVLPLALGIVIGALVGNYPISLPGGFTFRLGVAGGPLLVAILLGHYGRIGRITTRIPYAAKYLSREIGLVFFLAAAGTKAGVSFVEVFQQAGLQLLAFGALITSLAVMTAFGLSCFVFRMGYLASLGVVCGAKTSTPALGIVTQTVESDTPTVAYASIYPLSMVLVIVFAQILALFL